MDIIKKFNNLESLQKIAVLSILVVILATEQCFSVIQSLLTPEGKPIGGFC